MNLRTASSLIGIAVAIAALLASLSFARAVRTAIAMQIKELAPEIVIVRTIPLLQALDPAVLAVSDNAMDLEALLKRAVPEIEAISPFIEIIDFNANQRAHRVNIYAVAPDACAILDLTLAYGRFFSDVECDRDMPVCVLGEAFAREVGLNDGAAIGSTVSLRGQDYRVVGILLNAARLQWCDLSFAVFVPAPAVSRGYRDRVQPRTLIVRGRPDSVRRGIGDHIREATEHAVTGQRVTVSDQQVLVERRDSLIQVLDWVLAGLLIITGGVACVNSANVLLALVGERTTEIGLRRALGARHRHIIQLFVFEAIWLGAVSSAIGISAGFLLRSEILEPLPRLAPELAQWSFTLELNDVLLVLAVVFASALIGGIGPAIHACRVDPSSALRDL